MKKYFLLFKQIISRKNIFLFIGAIFIIPLGLTSASYMNRTALNNNGLPLWLVFLCSSISILCAVYYITSYFIEKRDTKQLIPFSICIIAITSNLITTLIQPDLIESSLLIKMHYLPNYGDYYSFSTLITWNIKLIYIFQFSTIVLYTYAAIFIFSKTIKDFEVVVLVNYVLLAFFLFTVVFSMFTEIDKYGQFITCLLTTRGGISLLPEYAIFSIFSHRNIYAMFLIMVMMSNLVVYSFTRKKIYIFFVLLISMYLFFTFSKSMILLSYISLLVFFYIFNIYTYKENVKFKKILLLASSILVVVIVTTISILYFSNSMVREVIDPMIKYFGTISTRKAIWDTVIEILKPSWFVTGRGYGVIITIINDASYVIIGHEVSHEHSWFFSMLSIGGVLLVCIFIIFIFYLFYSLLKSYKVNFLISLSLSFGFFVLFVQSFIENSFYLLFVIAMFLEILKNTITKQAIK